MSNKKMASADAPDSLFFYGFLWCYWDYCRCGGLTISRNSTSVRAIYGEVAIH